MSRPWILALASLLASAPAVAQDPAAAPQPAAARCATPDTLVVTGLQRTTEAAVRAQIGFAPGTTLTAADLQRGIGGCHDGDRLA